MEIINFLKINSKNLALKFIVFSFPLALVSGPLIPDLIISLSSLFFLIFFYKEFFNLIKKNLFIKIFFLFFLYLVINSFFSDFILVSIKSSLTYIRFVIFVCVIYYLYNRYPDIKYIFFLGLLFTFIILCIDANIQYLTGRNVFGFEPQKVPLRISGMFKDELILGSFLSRLFPLLVGLFVLFFHKKKYFLLNLFFLTLLVTFTIIISAERTATALHLISILLLIFFLDIKKKFKFFIFISLLIVSAIFINSNVHVKHRVINETLLNSDKAKYVFSKVHHAHYLTAINIFLEKPLLGSGAKTFRYICDEDKYKVDRFKKPFNFWQFSCSTHPHNLYMQLLSETGIFGFIFLMCFFIYIIVNLFKKLPKSITETYYKKSIYICLFVNFFPFAPSGNFFNNYVSMIYILPISLMLLKTKLIK
tara:strand:+ start:884 stop:2143 length:1260 start_codon:yes stop_codon:yes gene_type:complete